MTIAGSGFKAAITLRSEISAAMDLQKHARGFLVRTHLKMLYKQTDTFGIHSFTDKLLNDLITSFFLTYLIYS